jgi:hypothetical protein
MPRWMVVVGVVLVATALWALWPQDVSDACPEVLMSIVVGDVVVVEPRQNCYFDASGV